MIARPLCLFWTKAYSPYSYYKCQASDTEAVRINLNVFSYGAVWAENRASRPIPSIEFKAMHQVLGLPLQSIDRTNNLPVPSRCATCYVRLFRLFKFYFFPLLRFNIFFLFDINNKEEYNILRI